MVPFANIVMLTAKCVPVPPIKRRSAFGRWQAFLISTALAGAASPLFAASVTLQPSKDNTIYGDGSASLSNGAGPVLFAGSSGVNGGGRALRSLVAFDL